MLETTQPILSSVLPTSDWEAARRKAPPEKMELHDRTFKWLATLPVELRPMRTALTYPRIVNRIGDLWGHCEYTRLYFQSLLIDRRKGRRGFPLDVKQELLALQQHYFENFSGLPAILWDAVPVHPQKIPDMVFPLRQATEIDVQPLSAWAA
jgi:hypothetical protein